jgi:hypothetical protein
MKKILFFLFITSLLLVALTGCIFHPNPNIERNVQGDISAVSSPFNFNGLDVFILVWQIPYNPGAGDEDTRGSIQWLCYPTEFASKNLERKQVVIKYKIISGESEVYGNTESWIPLVQIVSIENLN